MRNIILLCNQFLGLKLFENPAKAFLELTFDETYFPRLLTALGWAIEGFSAHNWDKEEVENKLISVKLQVKVNFDIEVQSLAHAQLITPAKVVLGYQEKLFTNLVGELSTFKRDLGTTIHLLDLMPLYFSPAVAREGLSEKFQLFCYYLYPLKNIAGVQDMVATICENWDKSLDHLLACLIEFLSKQADEYYLSDVIGMITLIKNSKEVIRETAVQKILKDLAEKTISSMQNASNIRLEKTELLRSFIDLKKVDAESIEKIIENYKKKHLMNELADLYEFLISRKMFVDEARRFISEKEFNKLPDHYIVKLFKALVASKLDYMDELNAFTTELIHKKQYGRLLNVYSDLMHTHLDQSADQERPFMEKALRVMGLSLREIPLEELLEVDRSRLIGDKPFEKWPEHVQIFVVASDLLGNMLVQILPGTIGKKFGLAQDPKIISITRSLLPVIAKYVKTKEQADIVINFFKKIECDESGLPIKDGPTLAKELEAILAK
jgi:hypothetical protein